MKFSEEYKKSAENMSPDRQTIDRMKAAVLKELQEHPDAPAEQPGNPKKPLPLRRIAYIGGAVAACAVITVAAVNIVPSLKASNGMIASGSSMDSMAAAAEIAESSKPETSRFQYSTAEIAEDTPADEVPDCDVTGGIANSDSIDYGYDDAMPNPDSGDGTIFPGNITEEIPANGAAADADSTGSDVITDSFDDVDNGHTNPSDSKINQLVPATMDSPAFSTEEPSYDADRDNNGNTESGAIDSYTEDAWDYVTQESPRYSDEATMDVAESTCDAWAETEEIYVSEEEWSTEEPSDDNRGNPESGGAWVIVRSPQGWLTADGKRYDAVENIPPPANTDVFYWGSSPVENTDFCLVIDGDMLYLFDYEMNYIGAYKKR